MNFKEGDRVVLNARTKAAQIEPDRYESGVVVYVASYHVIGVMWNGFEEPIAVLADEIEKVAE